MVQKTRLTYWLKCEFLVGQSSYGKSIVIAVKNPKDSILAIIRSMGIQLNKIFLSRLLPDEWDSIEEDNFIPYLRVINMDIEENINQLYSKLKKVHSLMENKQCLLARIGIDFRPPQDWISKKNVIIKGDDNPNDEVRPCGGY